MADGAAPAAMQVDAEMHLENCMSCKATLRELRSTPGKVASLFPVGAAAFAEHGFIERAGDAWLSFFGSLQERIFGHVGAGQGAEIATAKKIVAVSAIAATLAGGGAVVHEVTGDDSKPRTTPAKPSEANGSRSLLDTVKTRRATRAATSRRRVRAATRDDLTRSAATTPEASRQGDPGVVTDPTAVDGNDLAPAGSDSSGQGVQGLTP
jgi:hypothetical protein